MALKIIRPGLHSSIQDLGRYGYQKYGVGTSGAMDSFALRTANLLVGNEEGEAAIEMTLIGPAVRWEADALMAITGGDLSPTIDGHPVPLWRPVYVKKGSVLRFGACRSGCRAYLAVAGGFALPEEMGSRSTYLRAGIGGYRGRALREGDVLPWGTPTPQGLSLMRRLARAALSLPFSATDWYVSCELLPGYAENPMIRVMRGNQFDCFTAESRNDFFRHPFQVTPQSDRMGYRLRGPSLQLSDPLEMVSEAVANGTIQVPPDGNPIILLADRQTTGGYPKIAQVATVDLPVIAQVKPGEKIRFQEISLQEAEELHWAREKDMEWLKQGIAFKFQKTLR
ncbi:5-oxoprolinase subunit PxpC [Bacillaceae bacterium]